MMKLKLTFSQNDEKTQKIDKKKADELNKILEEKNTPNQYFHLYYMQL